MDFKKIMDLISGANIDTNKIYELIALASDLDLTEEDNQRLLIKKGFELTNKNLDLETENQIIDIIKEKGITQNLFDVLK
jgi:hypothetical protein